MRIAVLFDGAGLARLGLESVGHECIGYEIDPVKHYLSQFVGAGRVVCANVLEWDFSGFDAVWASPPCQVRSRARTQGEPLSPFAQTDFVAWSLSLPNRVLWVESVLGWTRDQNGWGTPYNAAQFTPEPIQNRTRLIGGRYPRPETFRVYKPAYRGVCPAVTATEYKGCASDRRRASRYYGRKMTVDECADRMGFKIPEAWRTVPPGWTSGAWRRILYESIGNGVPVYMARAFGIVAK